MRTIFLVLDSLNRHFLDFYGGSECALTPNLNRLAARGVVFDNHWCGSMPCMPARREMMTGRLNFLETPWSPVMPWDRCLPKILRERCGTYSHMITDHYHYYHSGGEGYHDLFDSWEFERGQEGDVWRPLVKMPPLPEGRGKSHGREAFWRNRAMLDTEDDLAYPTPRCFQRAAEFIDLNRDADNWHLHLEVFDPHEPFVCPQRYLKMYNDEWDKYFYQWPAYAPLEKEDDAEAVAHIRRSYAATLTMADHWLGVFLDRMDACNMWRDTTLIVTTDHGHLLGEHGYWAKNYMADYRELAHIPLIVVSPEGVPGRRAGMTATMDIMPTLLELFGVDAPDDAPDNIHGRSFRHLLARDGQGRADTIFGYFGKDVNYTDGRYIYTRQPVQGSAVYEHTCMPRTFSDFIDEEIMRGAEAGVFLPSQRGIPCWRIARESRRHHNAAEGHQLFDLASDSRQEHPLHDPALEARLTERLRELLREHEAPECQYARLELLPAN